MFTEKCGEVFSAIGENRIMVLATCTDNRVTARSMSVVIFNEKFYFQTDKSFLKYEQLTQNRCVALCWNNIQIEGICKEIGHPYAETNRAFSEMFQKHYVGSYDKYSHLKNETVFEIEPVLITAWNYDGDKPYREIYDIQNETYLKECYEV